MASYIDLYTIATGDSGADLRSKMSVAASIKAELISQEVSPTATRLDWAIETLEDPRSKVNLLLNYLLAADNALTVNAIETASDAAIQTRVNSAVDSLYP
jgi:hypothetical protein